MKKSFVIILAFLFVFAVFFSYAATWNADKPAVGNQIAEDIPDNEENFQELHDIIVAITDGTPGTTEPADFAVKILGYTERASFSYAGTSSIYIGAGAYEVDGKLARWDSQLTEACTGLGSTAFHYIYLDHSEITDGTAITATEITNSGVAPTWSASKHGWYNGSDRCIFAVRTNAVPQIIKFYYSAGFYVFDEAISSYYGAPDDTWTDVGLHGPGFAKRFHIRSYLQTDDAGAMAARWRVNGSSGDGSGSLGRTTTTDDSDITTTAVTDSSQKIEVRWITTYTGSIGIYTEGWYMPEGM